MNQRLITRQYLASRATDILPELWGSADLPPQVVQGSQVAVARVGSAWIAEIAIPRTIGLGYGQEIIAEGGTPGTGLTLERGTVIGLNIRMNKMGGLPDYAGDNDPLVGEWASLTELLSFLGLSLAGSEK